MVRSVYTGWNLAQWRLVDNQPGDRKRDRASGVSRSCMSVSCSWLDDDAPSNVEKDTLPIRSDCTMLSAESEWCRGTTELTRVL